MPFFAAQRSLFRAYDIRGSRQHFTDGFIHALGRAFAHLYHSQQDINNKSIIVIGYDVRHDSDVIAQKLASILTKYGLQIIQLGLITTPMMVFWAEEYQGHGMIVTASHSAKNILGVKWLVNHQSPSVEDIQALYQQVIHHQLVVRSIDDSLLAERGLYQHTMQKIALHKNDALLKVAETYSTVEQSYLPPEQVTNTYINAIVQVFKTLYPKSSRAASIDNVKHYDTTDKSLCFAKLDLIVVIDCMNGATSNIAQLLFEHFCKSVVMLNDAPNGDFPTGNPDPTEPHRLKQLQQSVINHQANIGIAFDGDGDRLMIIDNTGKVITPDHLLYLLAKVALTQRPTALKQSNTAPQILFDIKCSHHLPKLITDLGAIPVMSRTGSSLMRLQIQHSTEQIIFAGELSGHFIFNDNHFIVYVDAMYAALRLLHWLAAETASSLNATKNLADMVNSLPVIVSTADHYLPLPVNALSNCSIIEHLTRLCIYLQQLITATALCRTHPNDQGIINCAPVHCTCSAQKHSITLEEAKELLPLGTTLSCIDGVRLDFSHGFGVLRQSNTSRNLTARFAGDRVEDLKDIQEKFAALCRPFDENLAAQILAMPHQ